MAKKSPPFQEVNFSLLGGGGGGGGGLKPSLGVLEGQTKLHPELSSHVGEMWEHTDR